MERINYIAFEAWERKRFPQMIDDSVNSCLSKTNHAKEFLNSGENVHSDNEADYDKPLNRNKFKEFLWKDNFDNNLRLTADQILQQMSDPDLIQYWMENLNEASYYWELRQRH